MGSRSVAVIPLQPGRRALCRDQARRWRCVLDLGHVGPARRRHRRGHGADGALHPRTRSASARRTRWSRAVAESRRSTCRGDDPRCRTGFHRHAAPGRPGNVDHHAARRHRGPPQSAPRSIPGVAPAPVSRRHSVARRPSECRSFLAGVEQGLFHARSAPCGPEALIETITDAHTVLASNRSRYTEQFLGASGRAPAGLRGPVDDSIEPIATGRSRSTAAPAPSPCCPTACPHRSNDPVPRCPLRVRPACVRPAGLRVRG